MRWRYGSSPGLPRCWSRLMRQARTRARRSGGAQEPAGGALEAGSRGLPSRFADVARDSSLSTHRLGTRLDQPDPSRRRRGIALGFGRPTSDLGVLLPVQVAGTCRRSARISFAGNRSPDRVSGRTAVLASPASGNRARTYPRCSTARFDGCGASPPDAWSGARIQGVGGPGKRRHRASAAFAAAVSL